MENPHDPERAARIEVHGPLVGQHLQEARDRARAEFVAKVAEIDEYFAEKNRAEREATADRIPARPTPELLAHLVTMLRRMDTMQQKTDEDGGREVAWYYWRDHFEDALNLPRGALDGRIP